MNSIHDMGGMHGLGPIVRERDEPVFHAPWEGRVQAITFALGAWRKWNTDAGRHERERIPAAKYLRMTYYEIWFTALIEIAVRTGLVSRREVESGRPDPGAAKAVPPLKAERVAEVLARGSPYGREAKGAPRFKVGDRVRTRNIHPTGHTRLPRYARGKLGTVQRAHGVYVFPDSNAHFQGENPQPLYSVRFAATELWGEAGGPRDAVHLDLWEPYLDPA